jgi:hypothetical protein
MIALTIAIWCLVGSASLVWLGWDREAYTWGQLFFAVAFGCLLGALVPIAVALIILVRAEFWNKPIFGKSKAK